MSPILLLCVLGSYFFVIMVIAWIVARKKGSNDSFFVGNRQSSWYMVAFGMIGASISGVSFVSVPGMVDESGFTYLQMVMGFFFGYLVVAYLLLPLYYRLKLTTIYEFLQQRFGEKTHKTAAVFFIVAKMVVAATKLYIVVLVLQQFLFNSWGVPFAVTVAIIITMIYFYTYQGGIRSIIWTDCLHTIVLLLALVFIIKDVFGQLDVSLPVFFSELLTSDKSRVFVFNDWMSSKHFFKQFFSGVFVVIAMTGLDQDMIQKNLTCRTLKDAQRNMISYGSMFLPVNFLFLLLGFLLLMYVQQEQILLPATGDDILPFIVSSHLGTISLFCFLLGMISASFSSADSALTSITTSIIVDLFNIKDTENKRFTYQLKLTYLFVCILFFATIIIFNSIQNKSILDIIYTVVGYLYGPLLGLFAFGLFLRRKVNDNRVPLLAVLSPLLCFLLHEIFEREFGYSFGYELLMINGMLTFVGLLLISTKSQNGN